MPSVLDEAEMFLCCQELSQEKQRTLERLGAKEQEETEVETTEERSESTCTKPVGGEELGDVDLLQDLRHIEEQMKLLLKEKEQADDK